MKRFLVLFFLFSPLSLSAANKMSMVTYFPVPYVAYSRINVSDQLDAGLTSACNMNLGCNESSTNLQVNTLNVKPYSKLDLNGGKGVWSNSMTLGSGSDNGRIVFNKVRIQGGTSRSINVKDTLNVPSLKLFESDFPDCKQAGGKGGTMSWKSLKLKGAAGNELYLACGSQASGCSNPPESATKTVRCSEVKGNSYVGDIVYGWDESVCDWVEKSNSCRLGKYCFDSWEVNSCRMSFGGEYLYKKDVPDEDLVIELTNPWAADLHNTWKLSKYITVLMGKLDSGFPENVQPASCVVGEQYHFPKLYYIREGDFEYLGWYSASCRQETDGAPCQAAWPNFEKVDPVHLFMDDCYLNDPTPGKGPYGGNRHVNNP